MDFCWYHKFLTLGIKSVCVGVGGVLEVLKVVLFNNSSCFLKGDLAAVAYVLVQYVIRKTCCFFTCLTLIYESFKNKEPQFVF